MPRYIDADIAIREATQEGAYGYISAEEIDKIPTVDVRENVKGEWIKIRPKYNGKMLYECSNCHKSDVHERGAEVPFCWHCGADMRGDANAAD